MQKKFSNKEIEEKFKHLLLKGWNLSEDKIYIQKTFVFKNFKEAFSWMCRIAFIAEEINHHPNWTNVFKTVDISLSTHDAGGLTELDLDFANAVEREA